MDIAQAKRRENIAEYILYLWQLEDLLRALQFSPEAIFSTLIAPRKDIAEEQKHVYLLWYMDIANLLHQEGKDEKGHLEHTLHLIGDLHDLHLQLMKLPVGAHYRQTYAKLEPELPRLRAVVGNPGMNDTELCFRALYAAMLYRIKGEGDKQAVTDTLEYISPVIAELAAKYGKTPAQVIMRWQVQEGNVVIPGSKTAAHIAENIDVFDFELTDAEMAQISALDKGKPFYVRTDEALAGFAAWHPDVEGQK